MSAQMDFDDRTYEDEKFSEEFDTLKKQRTPQEQIAIDVLDTAARDEMFDELVIALEAMYRIFLTQEEGFTNVCKFAGYSADRSARERAERVIEPILSRARLLQRSGK